MAEQKPVMERGEMRKLLAKSKSEPVNCSMALSSDGQHGLLLMDKIKQPRALEKLLLKDVPDAKNTRWGTAFVDVDINPKLARFRINRALPGIARRLVKALKGTGYSKVEIVQDDEQGTVLESAGSEEEEGDDAPSATESPAAAAAPAAPLAASPEPPAAPAADDFGALTQRLIALAGQIKQADPAKVATLAALAGKAKTAIGAKDASTAKQVLDAIESALGQAPGATPGAAPNQAAPNQALQKIGAAWTGIAARIQADLAKLEASIVADFPDQAPAISAAFKAKTAPLVGALIGPLSAALQQAATSSDPTVMTQVKSGLEQAQALLASSTIVADIDGNPFMTMSVGPMISTTLGALEKAVH